MALPSNQLVSRFLKTEMSMQNFNRTSEEEEEEEEDEEEETRKKTPDVLVSDTDEEFLQSLFDFIRHEKSLLRIPEEESPDELRFMIQRSVFSRVIGRATAYRRLLLTIKSEYDDSIMALKRRQDEVKMTQRNVAAAASHHRSLVMFQRRAEQLRLRISDLQSETREQQEELRRRRSSVEQRTWIPGLTVAQSEDPQALDEHLRRLQAQRDVLLDRRGHCVPLEVKGQLDSELQLVQRHRDQLRDENLRLKDLYKCLRFVCRRLSCWDEEEEEEEEEEEALSLEEPISCILETIREMSVTDEAESRSIDSELRYREEPSAENESKVETDHLDRFLQMFDSAQFEEAALLAARSPAGVLRNMDTMEMFEGVTAAPGSAAPLLLFFQALLSTAPPGVKLSSLLSLRCIGAALRHGATPLLTHAATQDKLTCSELLGDLLTEHAHKNPNMADLCLSLAADVYRACGRDRKCALSLCGRGLVHSSALFMQHKEFSADDCMWVLSRSPSLSLLQQLTLLQKRGRAAMLSVGGACSSLLLNPRLCQLALQLLDGLVNSGPEVLEDVILKDGSSSVEVWVGVASQCSEQNRADLSRVIRSVLLEQSGTGSLSPEPEGAGLMDHVLM